MSNEAVKANELLVGQNDRGEVVINHPNIQPDEQGAGYIVFSPEQARDLASLLIKHADQAAASRRLHHHVALWQGESLTQECAECGQDLMHESHIREVQP